MEKIEKKRAEEKEVITKMIKLYCHKKHKTGNQQCKACQELIDYATKRIDYCPFMLTKSFCSQCSVHCYEASVREKIRQVMRFSGPRMLFVDPIRVIHHAYDTVFNLIKNQVKKNKENKNS